MFKNIFPQILEMLDVKPYQEFYVMQYMNNEPSARPGIYRFTNQCLEFKMGEKLDWYYDKESYTLLHILNGIWGIKIIEK